MKERRATSEAPDVKKEATPEASDVKEEVTSEAPDVKIEVKERPICVVSLDIHTEDLNYKTYKQLSALEKIERIEKRIIKIYNEMQRISPESWVVISWREFGISDPQERSIDGNAKDSPKVKLKEMLQRVTKTCPHLEVISGPTLVRKIVKKEKVRKTKDFYQSHEWIEKIEKASQYPIKQMQSHREVIDKLVKENRESPYIQYKTISYAVVGEEILRHGKIAPYDESKVFANYPLVFYQPGKNRSYNPLFEFKNQEAPRLGLEICYENFHATLHQYSKNKEKQPPDLQFLLSNHTDVKLESIIAKNGLIHIDSIYPTEHILLKPMLDRHIFLYRCNLLNSATILEGPIEPVIPLQLQMKDFIETLKKKCEEEKKEPGQMAQLKKLSRIIDNYNKQCINYYPDNNTFLYALLSDLTKLFYAKESEAELKKATFALITIVEAFQKKYESYIEGYEEEKSSDEEDNSEGEESFAEEGSLKEHKRFDSEESSDDDATGRLKIYGVESLGENPIHEEQDKDLQQENFYEQNEPSITVESGLNSESETPPKPKPS